MSKPSKSIFFVKELIKRSEMKFRENIILDQRKKRRIAIRTSEYKNKFEQQYKQLENKKIELATAKSYVKSEELELLIKNNQDQENKKLSAIETRILDLESKFLKIKTDIKKHKNSDNLEQGKIKDLEKIIKKHEKENLKFKEQLKAISAKAKKYEKNINEDAKTRKLEEGSNKAESNSSVEELSESLEDLHSATDKLVKSNLELSLLAEARQIFKIVMSDKSIATSQHHAGESVFIKNTSVNLIEFGRIANQDIVKNNNKVDNIKRDNSRLENTIADQKTDLVVLIEKDDQNSKDAGGANFYVSFGDLISVLLCFFVLFFAMGKLNNDKAAQLASTFTEQKQKKKLVFNTYADEDQMEMLGKVKSLMLDNVSPKDIIGSKTKTVEFLLSREDLFYPGEIELSENGVTLLLEMLKDSQIDNVKEVIVEGHTDDLEFSSFPELTKQYRNNIGLSSARAIKVLEIIEEKLPLFGRNIGIRAYGANRPLKPNTNDSNRGFNRRVVIKITKDIKKADTQDIKKADTHLESQDSN